MPEKQLVPRASRDVVPSGIDPPCSNASAYTGDGLTEATGYVHGSSGSTIEGNTTVTGSTEAEGTAENSTVEESTRGSTYYETTTMGSTTMDGYTQTSTIPTVYKARKGRLATFPEEGADASERSGTVTKTTNTSYSRGSSSGSESDYSGSDGDTAARGSELASAVEKALAIREAGASVGDDDANARALVQSDYHGGVHSYCDGEHEGGELVVQSEPKYLANAVDNLAAIVPVDSAVYEAYDHTFVTCPERLRFRFLCTFLRKNLDKKVMIFFSTANSAKYYAKLLGRFKIPVLTMHGKQKRERFIGIFFKFSDMDEGILCATDAAGRDLDIPPSVDWVIQFEPPDDPSEYILRVARISCDSDRVGRSLLFLNPGEQGFLKYYHSASIPVSEFEIPERLADVQGHVERHVTEDERLLRYAKDAYGSYLIAYASHGFRDVYNVHDLNKADVAAAFGLAGEHQVADDMTADTGTLASTYVGGEAVGGDKKSGKSSGWEKKEKGKSKSWMRGEKTWPHSQIKMHPKFKGCSSGLSSIEEGHSSSKNGGRIVDHLYD